TSMYQTVRQLLSSGVPPSTLWWLRFDHPLLMQIPLGELVRLVISTGRVSETVGLLTSENPIYLFLDELTYSHQWDLWLKTFYDETWPLRIVGTSSSTAALRGRTYESGVGRWEEQYLAPYLFSEYLALVDHGLEIPVRDALLSTITACIR